MYILVPRERLHAVDVHIVRVCKTAFLQDVSRYKVAVFGEEATALSSSHGSSLKR